MQMLYFITTIITYEYHEMWQRLCHTPVRRCQVSGQAGVKVQSVAHTSLDLTP